MIEKIPNVLKSLLYEYESSLKNHLGNKILGVYLYNSVALGAFDKEKSDIDFITILNEEFEEKDISVIRFIHDKLNSKYKYAKRMEGMYITKDKIGKLNSEIEPYIFLCDGEVKNYGYYDINYVTWWTLKYNGISINSPDVNNLNINVRWNNIIEAMDYNLNEYWENKLQEKDIFLSDAWIEFAILTLCRILYTLENKSIVSKVKSTKYVLMNIPDEYKLIIEEALRIRKSSTDKSLYETKLERENKVKGFMNYIIDYCNKKYNIEYARRTIETIIE